MLSLPLRSFPIVCSFDRPCSLQLYPYLVNGDAHLSTGSSSETFLASLHMLSSPPFHAESVAQHTDDPQNIPPCFIMQIL